MSGDGTRLSRFRLERLRGAIEAPDSDEKDCTHDDLDEVAARIEPVTPDIGEQLLASDDRADTGRATRPACESVPGGVNAAMTGPSVPPSTA